MSSRSPGGTEEPGGGERCPSEVSASAAVGWTLAGARGTPPAEDPDRELVARWKAGDPGAFEELVRRHESRVYRFLLRMRMGYPAQPEERRVIAERGGYDPVDGIKPAVTREQVRHIQEQVDRVKVDPALLDYVMSLVAETRRSPFLSLGV